MLVEMPIEEYIRDLWKGVDVVDIEAWSRELAEQDFKRDWDADMEPYHVEAVKKTEKAIRDNLGEALTCNVKYIREYAKLVEEENDASRASNQ